MICWRTGLIMKLKRTDGRTHWRKLVWKTWKDSKNELRQRTPGRYWSRTWAKTLKREDLPPSWRHGATNEVFFGFFSLFFLALFCVHLNCYHFFTVLSFLIVIVILSNVIWIVMWIIFLYTFSFSFISFVDISLSNLNVKGNSITRCLFLPFLFRFVVVTFLVVCLFFSNLC